MRRIRVSASALLLALASANPTAAQQRQAESASRIVHHGDLDLASEAGVMALDRRLASAIRSLCRRSTPYVPHQARSRRECREQALHAIRAQRSAAIRSERSGSPRIGTREHRGGESELP